MFYLSYKHTYQEKWKELRDKIDFTFETLIKLS